MEIPEEKILEIHKAMMEMSIASYRYSEAAESLLLQLQPYLNEIHNNRMLNSQNKRRTKEKEICK